MKYILLLCLSLLSNFCSIAQIDRENALLQLAHFEGNAALSINKEWLKVQKEALVDSFPLTQTDEGLSLRSTADSSRIFEILGTDATQLHEVLSEQAGNNNINKLLDITAKMKDQKLILSGTINNQDTSTNLNEEGGVSPSSSTPQENWTPAIILALASLGIGVGIGSWLQSRKNKPTVQTNLEPSTQVSNTSQNTSELNDKLKRLEAELKATKELNNQNALKTAQLIEGDNKYYQSVFDKIILPLEHAMEQGKRPEILKYMTMAMAQLSSFSRIKMKKKQNYDEANVQGIMGNEQLTAGFPEITAETPIDKIPTNLRIMVNILEDNEVTHINNTVIKGYQIK